MRKEIIKLSPVDSAEIIKAIRLDLLGLLRNGIDSGNLKSGIISSYRNDTIMKRLLRINEEIAATLDKKISPTWVYTEWIDGIRPETLKFREMNTVEKQFYILVVKTIQKLLEEYSGLVSKTKDETVIMRISKVLQLLHSERLILTNKISFTPIKV